VGTDVYALVHNLKARAHLPGPHGSLHQTRRFAAGELLYLMSQLASRDSVSDALSMQCQQLLQDGGASSSAAKDTRVSSVGSQSFAVCCTSHSRAACGGPGTVLAVNVHGGSYVWDM